MNRTLFTIPACLLLVGCFEKRDPSLEDGPYCENTPTVVTLEETTELGFSGADLMALAEGGFDETLTWIEDGSTTPVHVSVGYAEGEVRYVSSEAVYPDSDEPTIDIGIECQDYLEVDVSLVITTEDGALDESLELALRSDEGTRVSGSLELDHTQLDGSYEFTLMDPSEYDSVTHFLDVLFEESGCSGELMAQAEGCDDDCTGDECTCWASNDTVASWGGEPD
jgi:hypothetical protein